MAVPSVTYGMGVMAWNESEIRKTGGGTKSS